MDSMVAVQSERATRRRIRSIAASIDMRPQDDYRNGDDGGEGSRPASASGSDEGSGGEGCGGADELLLFDEGAPARALAALNALRKSRQHYDVVLVADGAEVAAHRAVLAAASPYLLDALQTPETVHRVEQVDAASLRALVEFAYTGRLMARGAAGARRLYLAAWRLHMEGARAPLAARLLRAPRPADCLQLRALPGLAPDQLRALDDYIAENFEEICSSGALGALPEIQLEMLRDSSAADGGESPACVAAAALAWLRARPPGDLEELCSRTHMLYVNEHGELRDCGELPAGEGEAPEVGRYRQQAEARALRPKGGAGEKTPELALGGRVARASDGDWAVLAARATSKGGARALVALRGQVVAARVAWREGGGVARGGALGGDGAGERRAPMREARCAVGAASLGGRLLVCGGYDSARVLRSAEAYEPGANAWTPLPDMRVARARFPAARLADALYVVGGSDGHAELDSVDALEGGKWRPKARLPSARSHAAAAADEMRGLVYVVGGWASGLSLRRVDKYSPETDSWAEAPPLINARSQCAGVMWGDTLWALGGCDTWHCLSSTESLALGGGAWEARPPLPTARRSVGGGVWRGRLVSAGGSDGATSLRRVDWLLPNASSWAPGPDLRRARAGLALADLGGALFVAGGFDGKQFLACVECLYEPDGEWTTLCAPPPPSAPLPPPPPNQNEGENAA